MSDSPAIDYRPLSDPDNPAAFRAFKHWARTTHQPWAPTRRRMVVGYLTVGFLFGGMSVLLGAMSGGVAGHFSGSETVGAIFSFVPAAVFVVSATVYVLAGLRRGQNRGEWEQWYRSYHFAAANGFNWQLNSTDLRYRGSAFRLGTETTAYEHFSTASGRHLDIGNLSYVTGSGKSRSTHQWGYMALKLDRRMPHCVVDAHSNNGMLGSNMPTFAKDQVLSLEGDFDRYFTLYCPKEYERDALYIFTPDLMALLIDNVSALDVEIIDDWMFVYSTKPWALHRTQTWSRLLMIAHTIGGKTLARTGRYRDDRAAHDRPPVLPASANDRVEVRGQRLAKRNNWTPTIAIGVGMVVVFTGAWLLSLVAL